MNKGYALSHLGIYQEAVKSYEEAIRIKPDFAEPWYNKEIALDNLGRHEEAKNVRKHIREIFYSKKKSKI